MQIQVISPDFEWRKYQKVTSGTGKITASFPKVYKPVFTATTAHRRLAKIYEDGILFPASDNKKDGSFVIGQWLSLYGLLYSDKDVSRGDIKDEEGGNFKVNLLTDRNFFDDFFTHAGIVWWIVQVFNLFRRTEHNGRIGLDPNKITASEASSIILTVPNPLRVRPSLSSNLTFTPATWAARKISNLEIVQSQGNLNSTSTTWDASYLDLINLVRETIQKNLEDAIEFKFINWTNNFVDYLLDQDGSKEILVDKISTHKIQVVIPPKNLIAFIWLLLAEEFTGIPNIDFENCNGYFDKEVSDKDGNPKKILGCKNVLKRSRLRPCIYCNALVYKRKEKPENNNGRLLLATEQGITMCTNTNNPERFHKHRQHKRKWCSQSCRSLFRKNYKL